MRFPWVKSYWPGRWGFPVGAWVVRLRENRAETIERSPVEFFPVMTECVCNLLRYQRNVARVITLSSHPGAGQTLGANAIEAGKFPQPVAAAASPEAGS